MQGFAAWLADGGPWVYAIAAVALIAFGVIIERFIALVFRFGVDAKPFMNEVQDLVHAEKIDQALAVASGTGSAALGRVIKAGLVRANKSADDIQNALEEAALEVVPQVTRRTQALSGIANIATLLGLVATIHGMIGAFEIASQDIPQAERQVLLGAAIVKAMYGAVFGLLVAIPTLAAHVYLGGVARKVLEEIDLYSVKLENLLLSRAKGRS